VTRATGTPSRRYEESSVDDFGSDLETRDRETGKDQNMVAVLD